MSNFTQIGAEIGGLVDRKDAAYGGALAKAATVLAIHFPDGLRPDQYHLALAMSRIEEKLARAATNNDPGGESPFLDIAGHAIKALVELKGEQGCGFANTAAEEGSKARGNFAAQSAEPLTTPSASESSEPSSNPQSQQPSQPTSASTAVPAPTATAVASESEVDREKRAGRRKYLPQTRSAWTDRSMRSQCAACTQQLPRFAPYGVHKFKFPYCSFDCGLFLRESARVIA